ncbi:MAG: Mfa1 fimbrilin C-terminal domain-containing protein, partial [Muribaculaceae bacterium]|nr:Mfa1 fimbrilin C-terminal domain-containing protein [Muribaculaceae bacterium]
SPLNMIQTNLRDILYTEDDDKTKLFAMSNSVYYPTQDAESEPQIAVPVAKDQLFNTEAEAKAALEENAAAVVDIYVERYAAKLRFEHKKANDYVTATSLINNTNEIPVTLSFVAKTWILNASCTESYIVKSYRQEADNSSKPLPDNYKFGALNSRINAQSISYNSTGQFEFTGLLGEGQAWTWNTPGLHRSYWGMSPAYFTTEYPEVSSDVSLPQATNDLSQHYYSYNELIEGKLGYSASDEEGMAEGGPFYFHETTVGGRGLNSKNPAAAVASVILVGDYTVDVNGTTLPVGTTFYTYLTSSTNTPLVYFESIPNDPLALSAVTGAESMLRRFIEQTSILFKQVDGGYLPFDIAKEDDMKTLVAALEIAEPSSAVKGDMKIAERFRTLQFKPGADTSGIYVATADGYQAIGTANREISLTKANQALMQQVGFCAMYTEGSAYFNIPVKHLGWYRAGNAQKDEENINWNDVRIGDFGVVRNHSYDINVSKIVGIGTGIAGHNSPIVPPADTKDYFVAYRVNILKWAVVPTQHVNL